MLRRLLPLATRVPAATVTATTAAAARASYRNMFVSASRPLLFQGSKKFDPSAAAGATSQRINPISARTRRQQKKQSPASGASRTQQKPTAGASSSASSPSTAPGAVAQKQPPPQQQSGKSSARSKQQIGRFNRITALKGLGFASYLYLIGESMTLGLTYLLHTDMLPIGDVGSWLTAIGAGGFADRYLERGPTVFGLRLSPRLLLNYIVANVCTYPLYSYQYALCVATAPALAKLTAPLRRLLCKSTQKRASVIPKAPSPQSQP